MVKLPADWAIKKALRLSNYGISIYDVKRYHNSHTAIVAFAHYIEQHEKEPSDDQTI